MWLIRAANFWRSCFVVVAGGEKTNTMEFDFNGNFKMIWRKSGYSDNFFHRRIGEKGSGGLRGVRVSYEVLGTALPRLYWKISSHPFLVVILYILKALCLGDENVWLMVIRSLMIVGVCWDPFDDTLPCWRVKVPWKECSSDWSGVLEHRGLFFWLRFLISNQIWFRA